MSRWSRHGKEANRCQRTPSQMKTSLPPESMIKVMTTTTTTTTTTTMMRPFASSAGKQLYSHFVPQELPHTKAFWQHILVDDDCDAYDAYDYVYNGRSSGWSNGKFDCPWKGSSITVEISLPRPLMAIVMTTEQGNANIMVTFINSLWIFDISAVGRDINWWRK